MKGMGTLIEGSKSDIASNNSDQEVLVRY